jgi:protocatechuate 3,4-dioxygenase beta subunit
MSLTRRAVLNSWLAAPLVLSKIDMAVGQERNLPLTPSCGDASPTISQTEGPFYSPRTPRKQDFRADGAGQPITVFGFVVDQGCRPLENVLIDLWHADADGEYDNSGYRFRGHQISDASGRFVFDTIAPGLYPGRTRHYHVKLAAGGAEVLTTQLYFPDEAGNARDGIFDERLNMTLSSAADGLLARYDFVISA